jgi:hypothetical protein
VSIWMESEFQGGDSARKVDKFSRIEEHYHSATESEAEHEKAHQ